jgi:hypothetical protein
MAVLKHGINGPFSGKVGTVVGTTWKGIDIIRSRPKPPTEFSDPQLANQMRMKMVQNFLRQLIEPLRIGFRDDYILPAAYHSAVSYHKKFAFGGEYPNFFINLPDVKIARGVLWIPEVITIENDDAHIQLSWSASVEGNARHDDQLLVVLWDEAGKAAQYSLQAYRSAGQFIWEPTSQSSGCHVWAAFVRQDRSMQSESMYLGVLS